MQEIWKSFVYYLIDAQKRNVEEEEYHSIVEKQLQLFGWAPYLGEICHKQNIPIGNNKYIQPDILIKKGNDVQFVIEVKRPVHKFTERERQQLESYMRQLKVRVGIYIGDHIEIMYDTPKSKDAISVLKLELDLEDKHGEEFSGLFSKANFSKEAIENFCEERIEELKRQANLQKIKENLIADANNQITNSLFTTLSDKYGETFSKDEIKAMLSTLSFSAISSETSETANANANDDYLSKGDKKQEHDHTLYSLNGGDFVVKRQFAYNVVNTYVKLHPSATYSELESIFKPEIGGSFGIIRTLDFIREKNYVGASRYFTKDNEILHSSDNISFAVSSQWGTKNIDNLVKLAEQLGYKVERSSSHSVPTTHASSDIHNNQPVTLVKCHLSRHSDANGIFNVHSQALTVLKGSKINPANLSGFKGAGLSTREKLMQEHTYSLNGEQIVSEDITFKSPSAASRFCVGGESNGWNDWKNEKGHALDVYRTKS